MGWVEVVEVPRGAFEEGPDQQAARSPGPGLGAVVDWIHVAGYPAAFNLADVAIRAGAVGALVAMLTAGRRKPRRVATPGAPLP